MASIPCSSGEGINPKHVEELEHVLGSNSLSFHNRLHGLKEMQDHFLVERPRWTCGPVILVRRAPRCRCSLSSRCCYRLIRRWWCLVLTALWYRLELEEAGSLGATFLLFRMSNDALMYLFIYFFFFKWVTRIDERWKLFYFVPNSNCYCFMRISYFAQSECHSTHYNDVYHKG